MKRCMGLIVLLAVLALPLSVMALEEVEVSAGSTFIDKIFNPVKPQLAAAGLSVRIIFSDVAGTLQKLEAGNVELAGQSLSFDDWVKAAAAKGYTVKDISSLTPHVITEEETVIVVNSSNSVEKLTKEQVQGLFSGKIQNWKEVGGKDAPVMVVWPRVVSGPTTTFNKQIMDGVEITKDFLDVGSINDTVDSVVSNPEAVSIANAEKVKAGSKRVVSIPLKRPLTLVSKGVPSAKVKKLLDYLKTPEAAKLFR